MFANGYKVRKTGAGRGRRRGRGKTRSKVLRKVRRRMRKRVRRIGTDEECGLMAQDECRGEGMVRRKGARRVLR